MKEIIPLLLLLGCSQPISEPDPELDRVQRELRESIEKLSCTIEVTKIPNAKMRKKICNNLGRVDRCRMTREEARKGIDVLVDECLEKRK